MFGPVRECIFLRKISFSNTGKECALVRLDPAVIGQPWGAIGDIEYFVLANRFKGEWLFPISDFPCFVHIARILANGVPESDLVDPSDLESVAWGELYRTRYDAEHHVFPTK